MITGFDLSQEILAINVLLLTALKYFSKHRHKYIRELKQTDAAPVNRQISIQIQSDGCQGPTEFTWP